MGGDVHGHGHSGAAAAGGDGSGTLAFPAMPTSGGQGATPDALQALRNFPRFGELAATVARNPEALPQMLVALAQSHPDIVEAMARCSLKAIRDNQDEFLTMLGEGADDEDGHGDEHSEDGEDDDGALAGSGEVQVTAEEESAIERLAALGFPPERALEAYLACDRKEELAANFLFDNMGD